MKFERKNCIKFRDGHVQTSYKVHVYRNHAYVCGWHSKASPGWDIEIHAIYERQYELLLKSDAKKIGHGTAVLPT